MSNYPPGVTGNEYEIAGADAEWIDDDFECSNEDFEFVRISPYAFEEIEKLVNNYFKIDHLESVKANLRSKLSHISAAIDTGPGTEIVTSSCGYYGPVEKQSYRDNIWWECPRCKKSYEQRDDYYYGE